MREEIKRLIKDKKVLILGFGREGRSTLKTLEDVGGYREIGISDINPIETSLKSFSGEDYLNAIDEYDIIFKSPGVVLKKYSKKITSETEIFLKAYRDRVIGITGTKGKSTVSSLIYEVLREGGVKAKFGGNIGVPIWDLEIDKDTLIVMELSSHQLEYTKYSPHIALFLNLFEDHLDHYGSLEKYYKAKTNIYRYQETKDLLYCERALIPKDYKGKIIVPDIKDLPFKSLEEVKANLKGEHNLKNVSFAYEVVKNYVSEESFIETIKNFKPLSHRLEYIGNIEDIDFYDDSISTTNESTIEAIKSIKNIETLIVGGMDRGINYHTLIDFFYKRPLKLILIYESGERILNEIDKNEFNGDIYYEDDLKGAVKKAKEITNKGGAVVLSPAAASYGHFRDFEERGEKFKEFVIE